MYYIYRITNLINGKTYIGQHKYKKLNDTYMGSGVALHRAFKKYGIENFIKDVIVANIKDKETIDKLEIKYIAYERASNGNGCYNIAEGGEGWHGPRSEEWRRKQSEAHKGKHPSEETRIKLSEAKIGKSYSEKTKKKISEALKCRKLSEEHKKHLSEARKGKKCGPHSEETKRKIAEALKGKSKRKPAWNKGKPRNWGKHWKLVDGKRVWY